VLSVHVMGERRAIHQNQGTLGERLDRCEVGLRHFGPMVDQRLLGAGIDGQVRKLSGDRIVQSLPEASCRIFDNMQAVVPISS
jgi:hypothetical protein